MDQKQKFYRLLFQAVDQFRRFPDKDVVTVVDNNRPYLVYKSKALTLFRRLNPMYNRPSLEDNNQLINYLYLNKNYSADLKRLLRQESPNETVVQDQTDSLPVSGQDSKTSDLFKGVIRQSKKAKENEQKGPRQVQDQKQTPRQQNQSRSTDNLANDRPFIPRHSHTVGLPTSPILWVVAVIAVLIVFVFASGQFESSSLYPPYEQEVSSSTPTSVSIPVSGAGPTSTASISQCSFYGLSGETKVGNDQLVKLVVKISDRVGIPSSILAGITRIEWQQGFANKNEQYIEDDYEAVISSAGAIGIAQFIPTTFEEVFRLNQKELAEKFNKHSQINYIQPQQKPPSNDTILRITSIKDSLLAAAFKIRMTKRDSINPWTSNEVKLVAERYHGACPYPGTSKSYCEDLAKSFDNCKSSPVLASTTEVTTIASSIIAACRLETLPKNDQVGAVKAQNASCLDAAQPPLLKRVKELIISSIEGAKSKALQCVGFVQALIGNTLPVGSAEAIAYTKIEGYRFIPNNKGRDPAEPGDIAVWSGGSFGHTALVTKVIDKDSFEVAEANYCSVVYDCGKVQLRSVIYDDYKFLGVQRRNNEK